MNERNRRNAVILLLLTAWSGLAATTEQTILLHLVEKANTAGFADLRGDELNKNIWESVTNAEGFAFCAVNWKEEKALYACTGKAGTKAQSRTEVMRMERVLQVTFPNWVESTDNRDDEHLFYMFRETGGQRKITLSADPYEKKPGVYEVGLQIHSTYTSSRSAIESAQGKQSMAGFVANDVRDYVSAAKQGFASFKEGAGKVRSAGGRWWPVETQKPWLAESCELQEPGNGSVTFFCILTRSLYKGEIVNSYKDLCDNIATNLAGWQSKASPFSNTILSQGFVSASGVSGQVWITAEQNGTFTLNYQIVARAAS
jgi:hypothetical protein